MRQLTVAQVANLLGNIIHSGAQFYAGTCQGAQPGQVFRVEGRDVVAAQPIPPGPVVLVQSGDQWLAYPPRQEASSQRVVQSVRRSPAPSGTVTTGPWWGVDYRMNFALGATWYPGLHLALRGPDRSQIIAFRHRGAEPPAEGQFNWANLDGLTHYSYNNFIWVDRRGKPHSLTLYEPNWETRTGSWPNITYTRDWNLLSTDWWFVATHDKQHQVFKAPRSLWIYTDRQRVCNNWAWAFPDADYSYVSQGMAPTPGYTVDLEAIRDASGIQYFDIAPVNDDGYFNAPGRVLMGYFEYNGNVRLFPGGPEKPFAWKHLGQASGQITSTYEGDDLPSAYTTEDDPLYLSPELSVAQPDHADNDDNEDDIFDEISPLAPLDTEALAALSLSEGGPLYRIWLPLQEQAMEVERLFVNGLEKRLAPGLTLGQLFDSEGRLLARIATYWAIVERRERMVDGYWVNPNYLGEDEEDGSNPRGIAIYIRQFHLGEITIEEWLESRESIIVIGSTGQILSYESERNCEYTLPILVNMAEGLRIEERYKGKATAYAESQLSPFSEDASLRKRDSRWTDDSTQGTYWVKTQPEQPDEEKPVDGQTQIYFPIPDTQMVPNALTLAVGQEYTLNYSQSVPPGLYDASDLPIHLIKLEGTDYGYSESLIEVPSYDGVSRTYQIWDAGAGEAVSRTSTTHRATYGHILNQNQARPECAAMLVEKLSPGAKLYGTYQGSITPEADQKFPEGTVIFRAEVIEADYEILPSGSWVPKLPSSVQQIFCTSAALFILKRLKFKITELIGGTNAVDWGPFGDYGQPFFHYPNLEGNTMAYRYSGYLYCEGSIRNLYRTGDSGAGLLAHALTNSPWLGLGDGQYWGQSYAWKDPYIWVLHRSVGQMVIAKFHRYAKLDGQGNVVAPAKHGRLVPRFRLDYSGPTVKCWLDGIHVVPEPYWPKGYENDNFYTFQNAALDIEALYREARAESP